MDKENKNARYNVFEDKIADIVQMIESGERASIKVRLNKKTEGGSRTTIGMQ